ncbi:phospholipase D-like domain-containing protein [Iodobacter sp.]|uniref:phospholipase D-like domain-containing protein n=1 Tax=Iodobacter sp. TaxID=1915058 RepID=UPI0025D948E8|nr:phospholipase D-like domain-containing protein [Iodobacter sp.]
MTRPVRPCRFPAIEKLPKDIFDKKKSELVWSKYLTLLNLRNWEMINKMPVTEQIYVHSKLLIADDRVAILGSANINDRSMMGDGDSELAVIIRDDSPVHIKLDGKNPVPVSLCVHQLRSKLWKKIFGLAGGETPASDLASVIEQPINPDTYEKIQKVAQANLKAYQTAFLFTPQSNLNINSIWPTWDKASMRMHSRMPFDPAFWRVETAIDRKSLHSWDAPKNVIEKKPQGVKGFIVALPIGWLKNENNLSGINLTLLADNQAPDHSTTIAMQSQPPTVTG